MKNKQGDRRQDEYRWDHKQQQIKCDYEDGDEDLVSKKFNRTRTNHTQQLYSNEGETESDSCHDCCGNRADQRNQDGNGLCKSMSRTALCWPAREPTQPSTSFSL